MHVTMKKMLYLHAHAEEEKKRQTMGAFKGASRRIVEETVGIGITVYSFIKIDTKLSNTSTKNSVLYVKPNSS
jgi:hypothetical protein